MTDNQTEFKRAYEKAIELLARRTHTSAEIRRKLRQRKINEQVVGQVLDELRRRRFLDDEQAAALFLENLIRYKTWGYYGLLQKLLSKGIEKQTAERLLTEQLSLEAEEIIARRVARKYDQQKQPGKNRAVSALQRKGFRGQVIARVAGEFEEG